MLYVIDGDEGADVFSAIEDALVVSEKTQYAEEVNLDVTAGMELVEEKEDDRMSLSSIQWNTQLPQQITKENGDLENESPLHVAKNAFGLNSVISSYFSSPLRQRQQDMHVSSQHSQGNKGKTIPLKTPVSQFDVDRPWLSSGLSQSQNKYELKFQSRYDNGSHSVGMDSVAKLKTPKIDSWVSASKVKKSTAELFDCVDLT